MLNFSSFIRINSYFPYGLFYFASGLGILIQHRKKYPFRFARDLWLMGIYALIHATSEWSYLFIPLQAISFSPQFLYFLNLTPLLLEALSFMFLFIFSLRLLYPVRLLRSIFIPVGIYLLWSVIVGILLIQKVSPTVILNYSQEFSHYMLLFPSSLLTALALYRQGKDQGNKLPLQIRSSLNALSVVFLLLAMLSILMVDPGPFFPANLFNSQIFYITTHIPVQLLRGLVGTATMIIMLKLLLEFNRETDRILAQAEEDAMRFSERERISQDLHDGVIQTLYATGMMLEATVRHLDSESPIREQLKFCIQSLNTSLLDLRHYITGLKSEDISHKPLKYILEKVLIEFEANYNIHPQFDFIGDDLILLTPNRQNHLYYVVKELLNNIGKHTAAKNVHLKLVEEPNQLVLNLWDNGQENQKLSEQFRINREEPFYQGSGMGLRNIRERITILRGEIDYSYPPTGGTLVTLHIPKEVSLENDNTITAGR